jgi:magnesium chelatase family protein
MILPPMSLDEVIETTRIHSVAGVLEDSRCLVGTRPYRSPHHTISDAGLIGGGTIPRPGDVSLGHNGVAFLDELPEFQSDVLEVMRQPLEQGCVTIALALHARRRDKSVHLRFLRRRHARLPRLAHADSAIRLKKFRPAPRSHRHPHRSPAVKYKELRGDAEIESSASVRDRVVKARAIQSDRYRGERGV